MSDSFQPDDEGPVPYAGQDLSGLLSGENRCVPEPLRPVVPVLDALRAAPTRAELSGEVAARAYFRKIMLSAESEPARPDAGAGEARTLILPAGAPGGEPHVARRRHRHRRQPQRGHWQAKALAAAVAAAAAVVIAGAVALAGTFSGSGGNHPVTAGGSRQATSTATVTATPGAVEGSGAPAPTVKPTHKASQQSGGSPSPGELCRKYFNLFAHPAEHASQAEERKIRQQLSSLANRQGGIGYYCTRLLQLWAMPQRPGKFPATSRYPVPGELPGLQGSQESQRSQKPGFSPGDGGSGNYGPGRRALAPG